MRRLCEKLSYSCRRRVLQQCEKEVGMNKKEYGILSVIARYVSHVGALASLVSGCVAGDEVVLSHVERSRAVANAGRLIEYVHKIHKKVPGVSVLSRGVQTPLNSPIYGDAVAGGRGGHAENLFFEYEGRFKSEYVRAINSTLLNTNVPDILSLFRTRFDVGATASYVPQGQRRALVQCGAKIRAHLMAGGGGMESAILPTRAVSGGVVGDSHTHTFTSSPLWPKHLYCTLDLGMLAGRESGQLFCTVGMFPFRLGRGITYGKYYRKDEPSAGLLLSTNESAPYAICLNGTLFGGKIGYDAYWARLDERASSFAKVFNSERAHVDREHPAVGIGAVNDVYALRIAYKKKFRGGGRADLESYFMLNDAAYQKLEFPGDANSLLWSSGWAGEFRYADLEGGLEYATNGGEEHVLGVDRNTSVLQNFTVAGEPYYHPRYSHVVYVEPGKKPGDASTAPWHGTNVLETDETRMCLAADSTRENALAIGTTTVGGTEYGVYSTQNRYRTPYTNTYKGWMVVGDLTYHVRRGRSDGPVALALSCSAGIASGDVNPYVSEKNKDFKGFIGLYENYAGGRVPSVFLLNGRKGARPVAATNTSDRALIDNSFSDLMYAGWGFSCGQPSNWRIRGNALNFWSYTALESESGAPLSRHLGYELNLIGSYKLHTGLYLAGYAGIFKPGDYYEGRAGLPLDSHLYQTLDQSDDTGYVQAKYTLGSSVGFLMSVGMRYIF